MRRLIAAVLLFVACRTAPTPVPTYGPGTEDLVTAARELNVALLSPERSAWLDRLLAAEFMFHFYDEVANPKLAGMPNGPRVFGRQFLHEVTGAPPQTVLMDVRVYGDIGVAISHFKWRGSYREEPFSYMGHLTDVWIRRDGRWQLLASSATAKEWSGL